MEEEFSKNQLKALKDIVSQTVSQIVGDAFSAFRDLIMQEIRASEVRVKQEILEGVGQMLDVSVIPQIDDHETRILKLEKKAAV